MNVDSRVRFLNSLEGLNCRLSLKLDTLRFQEARVRVRTTICAGASRYSDAKGPTDMSSPPLKDSPACFLYG